MESRDTSVLTEQGVDVGRELGGGGALLPQGHGPAVLHTEDERRVAAEVPPAAGQQLAAADVDVERRGDLRDRRERSGEADEVAVVAVDVPAQDVGGVA